MTEPYYVEIIEDVEPESVAPFYTVAVYLVELALGGPEEGGEPDGGWWYQCGQRIDAPVDGIQPEHLLTVFYQYDYLVKGSAEAHAQHYAESLQKLLDVRANIGNHKYELSSVISNGRYCAMVHPGFPPQHFPERKPHYE
jgi:hypothetical protein